MFQFISSFCSLVANEPGGLRGGRRMPWQLLERPAVLRSTLQLKAALSALTGRGWWPYTKIKSLEDTKIN